jgi:hypothetical protein
MSVVLAMAGLDGAVVASDCRRVEADGSVHDDLPTVFTKMDGRVIGAYTGVLQVAGREIADLLAGLPWEQIETVDGLAGEVKILLEEALTNMSPDEAAFEQRRLDVVLAARPNLNSRGRPVIRGLVFTPDAASQRVVGRIDKYREGWYVAGDDAAKMAVTKVLRGYVPTPSRLPRSRLVVLASNVIDAGVAASGPHAQYPETKACGGPAKVASL